MVEVTSVTVLKASVISYHLKMIILPFYMISVSFFMFL